MQAVGALGAARGVPLADVVTAAQQLRLVAEQPVAVRQLDRRGPVRVRRGRNAVIHVVDVVSRSVIAWWIGHRVS